MRLSFVLLSSVLVMTVALGAALFTLTRRDAAHDVRLAQVLQGQLLSEDRLRQNLLAGICASAAGLAPRLHESSGRAPSPAASAWWKPTVFAWSRTMGTPVWLLAEQQGRLRVVAATPPRPEQLPTREALLASTKQLTAIGDAAPLAIRSCLLPDADTPFWIVSVTDLATWAEQLKVARVTSGQRDPDSLASPLIVEIPAQAGSRPLAVRLAPTSAPGETGTLSMLLAICGSGLLLGALAAWLWQRQRRMHDAAVFDALDEAAQRVALGDLSSQIALRVGGRADQTFRSFDHMTHELREMRTKLRDAERDAAWQDMARRIAHEIKNPLFPIRTAMETLRKAHDRGLSDFDEIFGESTRAVLEEVQRLERIVREFAEFARLPKPRPGALDLLSLVRDVIARYAAPQGHLELTTDLSALPLNADREQITQVLINLIQNAQEATASLPAPKLGVRVTTREDQVALHVDDNGPGIAAADRERLFEPYVTTKRAGTGLGLAIARRIALDHGGDLRAGDSPMGGARLTLTLPLKDAATTTRPGLHSPSRP